MDMIMSAVSDSVVDRDGVGPIVCIDGRTPQSQ